MDQGEAVRAAPSDGEVERAIASVPGVVEASVSRASDSGRSRLRLRLASGEDAEAVAWSVAATLRERFGIALDPDAIRPVVTEDPVSDPVRVVRVPDDTTGPDIAVHDDADGARSVAVDAGAGGDDEDSEGATGPAADQDSEGATGPAADEASAQQLASTRERLTQAARDAWLGTELGSTRERLTSAAREAIDGGAPRQDAAPLAEPSPPPAPPSPVPPSPVPRRPSIRHLDTQRDDRDVRVTATLEHRGREVSGTAMAAPTSHGTLRAVAEATVAALRGLAGGPLVVGIDRISLQPSGDPASATVVVTMLTDRGEETLLGSSIVRNDPEAAVMRATLDALNRRVTPLLTVDADVTAGDGSPGTNGVQPT